MGLALGCGSGEPSANQPANAEADAGEARPRQKVLILRVNDDASREAEEKRVDALLSKGWRITEIRSTTVETGESKPTSSGSSNPILKPLLRENFNHKDVQTVVVTRSLEKSD